jgi:hypothetical protein
VSTVSEAESSPGPEAEHELRVLLEHAVPRLSAPVGRMEQVRRRVARRRRMRVTTVVLSTVSVAGVLLWPQLPQPLQPSRLFQPPPPHTVSPSQRTPAESPVRPGGTAVRFPALSGLVVDLPRGWHALSVATNGRRSVGFAASAPLDTSPSCAKKLPELSSCAPLDSLPRGAVLISFTLTNDPAHRATDSFALRPGDAPQLGCRSLGGKRELVALGRPTGARAGTALSVAVCLTPTATDPSSEDRPAGATPGSDPPPTAEQQARALVAALGFAAAGARSPAPAASATIR